MKNEQPTLYLAIHWRGGRWHANGRVLDEGNWGDGKKTGTWNTFNPAGSLKVQRRH